MKSKIHLLVGLAVMISSCSNDDDTVKKIDSHVVNYDFSTNAEGWEGHFADYPVGEEDFYELQFNHSPLPEPLDQNQKSLKQSGNNHSDDLFMYIKKKISGLRANQVYDVTFTVEVATNAASNSFGAGGSPASSVVIKAGATTIEPKKEVDDLDHYRMNIDIGSQVSSGDDMLVIGDFSNGLEENIYKLKTLTNESSFTVTTDENGEVWAIVGTDSGFEATTTIYYNKIAIEFEPINSK
ncbi:hypothetical protein LZ575_02905 [Antarcticibacterium sp. 1MA-6-2]|uniref:hypothetical protein n=1 Tax=Antarcticibacterium sp. 1MA-6-2 TaxID=2908210 RepID=UPI001F2410F5|nr:hypothetical protein [Antarcticibacterium sp. 1MA-6-2]UJH91654.1 hypothetical protein LZ575_02905 [Antarcticibacterium sp. 1MA-6-2]